MQPGFRQVHTGLRQAFDQLSTFLSKTWSRTAAGSLVRARARQTERRKNRFKQVRSWLSTCFRPACDQVFDQALTVVIRKSTNDVHAHRVCRVSAAERRQGYGCPCAHNDDCRSGFCYRRSCADDEPQGVLAVQLAYSAVRHLILAAVSALSHDVHRCSSTYQCRHRGRITTCATRSTSTLSITPSRYLKNVNNVVIIK